jgi:hypothetical protein
MVCPQKKLWATKQNKPDLQSFDKLDFLRHLSEKKQKRREKTVAVNRLAQEQTYPVTIDYDL